MKIPTCYLLLLSCATKSWHWKLKSIYESAIFIKYNISIIQKIRIKTNFFRNYSEQIFRNVYFYVFTKSNVYQRPLWRNHEVFDHFFILRVYRFGIQRCILERINLTRPHVNLFTDDTPFISILKSFCHIIYRICIIFVV